MRTVFTHPPVGGDNTNCVCNVRAFTPYLGVAESCDLDQARCLYVLINFQALDLVFCLISVKMCMSSYLNY